MSDDDFSDVPEALGLGGIFTGDGLSDHNNVPVKLTREGYLVSTKCERCGRPRQVTVSFQEMAFIALGRVPPGWFYNPQKGVMCWGQGCNCSDVVRPYPFGLTPNECSTNLNKAVTYGYISPVQAQQLQRNVQSVPLPAR